MAEVTEKDVLAMDRNDLKRLYLIKKVMERSITQKEVSAILNLCERQIRRIIQRIRHGGDGAVIHKARGRPSNHRIPENIKTKALRIVQAEYSGFGPTLASEKLKENYKIDLKPDTLRSWFNQKGIHYKFRKPRLHRNWRERKPCFGQMVQMDGSHHAWLEDRGPKLVLMAYIDDATNNVYARFYDYEGTLPAMDSFYRYSLIYGLPQSIYCDKHTTYKSYKEPTIEEELEGITSKSQFQRALEDLGVQVIYAHSPQAKGRVERLFKTLQDRLVKELRLKKANNLHEANKVLEEFLIVFNQRFRVIAQNSADLHQSPGENDLKSVLSIRHKHPLGRDSTITHRGRLYMVRDFFQNPLPKKILVEERIDGKTYFLNDNCQDLFVQVLRRPPKEKKYILQRPKLPKQKTSSPQDHFFKASLHIQKMKDQIQQAQTPKYLLKSGPSLRVLKKIRERLKNLNQTQLNLN